MKLSDYLVKYLIDHNITDVFLINGGALSHIVDSIGANKSIKYYCFQHEQAAAMAADAYYRSSGKMAAVLCTSGPGATNLITGVAGSWFDSIPVLIISGQVNSWEMKGNKKIRQLGFQEMDIVNLVKTITKFSCVVKKASEIRYLLDKAIYVAKSDRPGPVWIDIPINIQQTHINIDKLRPYVKFRNNTVGRIKIATLNKILKLINNSRRPLILAGNGIHIDGSENIFRIFVKKLGIPVVTSWLAKDLLDEKDPLNIGTVGVYGTRAANFSIQNCDLLISIGSRLDSRQTGGNSKSFAKMAKKIVVDIDRGELTKKNIKIDVPIKSCVRFFLEEILINYSLIKGKDITLWKNCCITWKNKYPIILDKYKNSTGDINPYYFLSVVSKSINASSTIVVDIGSMTAWVMQALAAKKGQRIISSLGLAPMGYGLPGAIGASIATNKQVVAFIGDGGMQVNIQELQTIINYSLPIKIFVFNNHGYGILKQFQDEYFESRYTASGSGYSAPNFCSISSAYGIKSVYFKDSKDFYKISKLFLSKKTILCELNISEKQKITPKVMSMGRNKNRYISNSLDNQWPYLSKEELKNYLITKKL